MEQGVLVSKYQKLKKNIQPYSEDISSFQNMICNSKYYLFIIIILNFILYLFSRLISFWKLLVIVIVTAMCNHSKLPRAFTMISKFIKRFKKENDEKYLEVSEISAILIVLYNMIYKFMQFMVNFKDESMINLAVKLLIFMITFYLDCNISDYGIIFIILNILLLLPYAVYHRRKIEIYPNEFEISIIKSDEN